jgi:uncharacterized protein (DUF697 family)
MFIAPHSNTSLIIPRTTVRSPPIITIIFSQIIVQNSEKKLRARARVNRYAALGTVIVIAAIIPGTTSITLAVIEVIMCCQIAKIYRGEEFTLQEAIAVGRIVGFVALAAPMLALEIVNLIPFAGWLVKGAVAGGVIKVLGEVIIARYEKAENQWLVTSAAEVPTIHSGRTDATGTWQRVLPPAGRVPPLIPATTGPAVDERLEKLVALRTKGLISQAECDSRRQQIVAEI